MAEQALLGLNSGASAGCLAMPRRVFKTNLDEAYSTNEEGRLGVHRDTEDGRRFVWCRANGTITQGQVVYSESMFAQGGGDGLGELSPSAGSATGSDILTDAAAFADLDSVYCPGWFVSIVDDAGEGQTRMIDRCLSTNQLRIFGTWTVALTTASDYITWSPWDVAPVAAGAALPAAHVIGVAQIAVTDGYFFWAQTRGPGVVKADDSDTTITVGASVICATGLAGAVKGGPAYTLATATYNANIANTYQQCKAAQVGIGMGDPDGGGDLLVPIFLTIE